MKLHTTEIKPNVIKVATKQRKQDITLKAKDIKVESMQTSKRERVANKQHQDYIKYKMCSLILF